MRLTLSNKLAKTLLVTLFISSISSLLIFTGFLDTWESRASDALYSPSNTLDDIVIIAIDDESLQDLGRWPWPRTYFAEVLQKINQSSVVGFDISFFESTDEDTAFASAIKNNTVVLAMEYISFSTSNGILYGEDLIKPNITLGNPGIDYETGFVNLYTDSDGVTRSFTPHISGIEEHDHFAVKIVQEYMGLPITYEPSRMLINLFGLPGDYQYISFSDIYYNKVNTSFFKDKIVLIGATASNLHDTIQVPISNQAMPGVEVNANLVQSILTQDFLTYQDDFSAVVIIFLFSILTGLLLYHFRIHIATILLAILIIAYILTAIYYFDSGLIINILYPFFSLVITYITIIVLYYLTEERSRKRVTSLFGKYVSPIVIDNLLKDPRKINLGGEQRTITIFFSDIRGFTPLSEKMKPQELVHLLNEYLTEMTSIIIENEGLVDKFMGDAIMAFWGAPLDQSDHAKKACSSSLEMSKKLKDLQKKWKSEGIPSFEIGIGLNSGEAIVGNMGSINRFDYTAMGDNVNLASRLEGLNKYYGTTILITEHTQNIISDSFESRKLDAVQVKGKEKPILIYELLSLKDGLNKKEKEFVQYYEKGLSLYFERNWKKAIESFNKGLSLKEDKASSILIERCEKFIKTPPPENWVGVWEMRSK